MHPCANVISQHSSFVDKRTKNMSNPALLRMLRSGATTDMHVSRDSASAVAQRGNPHVLFSGETYHGRFSMDKKKDADGYRKSHAFEKQDNREAKKKKDDDSDSDSEDEGPPSKKKRIYKKGEDADGDGKTGEGKEDHGL